LGPILFILKQGRTL